MLFLESWRQYHWCLSTSFKIKTNLYNCLCSLNCFSPPLSVSEHYPLLGFHTKREERSWPELLTTSFLRPVHTMNCVAFPEMTLNMWKVSRMISLKSVASFYTGCFCDLEPQPRQTLWVGPRPPCPDGQKFPRSCCTQALLTPLFWQRSASPSPFVSLSRCFSFAVGGFPN